MIPIGSTPPHSLPLLGEPRSALMLQVSRLLCAGMYLALLYIHILRFQVFDTKWFTCYYLSGLGLELQSELLLGSILPRHPSPWRIVSSFVHSTPLCCQPAHVSKRDIPPIFSFTNFIHVFPATFPKLASVSSAPYCFVLV